MPKRSREDTEETIRTILDAAVDQLIVHGYDKMSYTTLSEQTGISRTGISHHFPKKTDFISKLDDRLISILLDKLDLEGDQTSFSDSWKSALASDEKFAAVLRLIFLFRATDDNDINFTRRVCQNLESEGCKRFGNGFKQELECLVGKSLLTMN
ncbi:TetR family transcriptional regulator [Veronia pacifica]|uniref:Transcriptional regulator n=1 Tax=Veronia pacifica TaxID=1080227 RepID=A0A1C3EDK9_9GAMM|nr:TetR family transcriptional regulator [Veronia pacifica]ODA31318.1 transcriptional regulator [Veronia pacifica]